MRVSLLHGNLPNVNRCGGMKSWHGDIGVKEALGVRDAGYSGGIAQWEALND